MTFGTDFDPSDGRPYWYCFSCGKALGKQGSGGDFQIGIGQLPPEAVISFGYGSGYDEGMFSNDLNPHMKDWKHSPHITGWICDECITQKHERLLVRQLVSDRNFQYTKLAEHESTKSHIEDLDFFGTKESTYERKGETRSYKFDGHRDHAEITSRERAEFEELLLEKKEEISINRRTLARLLDALSGAEVRIQKHYLAELEASAKLYRRVRQQASLLTTKEIKEMRLAEKSVSDSSTWLLESIEWYESRYHQMSDAWEDVLKDFVQIHDEVNGGKPTIRGTDVTVESVFRLMKVRSREDVATQLGIPLEAIQRLIGACAKFFDLNFLEIMVYHKEIGVIERYMDAAAERSERAAQKNADVIEISQNEDTEDS